MSSDGDGASCLLGCSCLVGLLAILFAMIGVLGLAWNFMWRSWGA